MRMKASSRPLHTWLQLLRAPNLFTVPGDPLAGFVLASGGALRPAALLAIGASLALYSAGLLLNDLCDLAEDRAERPNRPLPSGAAEPGSVRAAATMLFLIGNAFAACLGTQAILIAIALTAAIVAYNTAAKRVPVLGAIVMGMCRGLSLLLGAAALGQASGQLVLLAAGIVTLYIASITHLARHETQATAPPLARILPASVLALGLLAIAGRSPAGWQYPGPATLAIALAFVVLETRRLFLPKPPPLPPIIGSLIRVLLIVQAALCLLLRPDAPTFVCALLLLALWPVSRAVSRRFYAS